MKVYCGECKWCKTKFKNYSYDGLDCQHPNNLKVTQEDTWYKLVETIEYLRDPENINENNSCKWFERKVYD